MRLILPLAATLLALTTPPALAQCGGSFGSFIKGLKAEALAHNASPATVDAFFASAAQDPKVIRADRSQGIFKKDFAEFSRAVISKNRLVNGQSNARKYADVFARIQADHGISPGILLAFWALETDYGAVQGDFNTLQRAADPVA